MGSTDGSRLTLLCAIGPFALEQERALPREHGIDVLIAKNSGGGAVAAKLAAARQRRIPVVMLEQPRLPGADREMIDVSDLAAAVRGRIPD